MSGAVVLRGEAGIGKTALLNATVDSAQDLSVIRLEGIESEMQLGYAALHRLLLPYLPRLEQLPEPQRDALQSAFGLTSLAPADRFLVSLAALSLLGDVAQEDPLLIVVDDAQWLDRESVAALVFVARRLHADRIALVFAARESLEIGAVFQGIPELWVSGLGEDFARSLLTSSVSDPVSYRVAERIIAVTRGNPLALMELSGELTSEHLLDHAPLPDPLPISDLIEARFLRQVRLLPADTQTDPARRRRRPGGGSRHASSCRRGSWASRPPPSSPRWTRDSWWSIPGSSSATPWSARPSTAAPRPRTDDVPTMRWRPSWTSSGTRIEGHCTWRWEQSVPTRNLPRPSNSPPPKPVPGAATSPSRRFWFAPPSLTPDLQRRAGRLLAAAHAAFLAGNAELLGVPVAPGAPRSGRSDRESAGPTPRW